MNAKTHGIISLRSGRARLETDYRAGDVGPGLLSLRLEDQITFESSEGQVRLDPWIADEYRLIEFNCGDCFVVCGAQAVVAVDAASLAWRSSVALEYEEGETVDAPWHVEIEPRRLLVLATERRVWCLDQQGAIRWIWSCATTDERRWIGGEPTIEADQVCVPLRALSGALSVWIQLEDGRVRTAR